METYSIIVFTVVTYMYYIFLYKSKRVKRKKNCTFFFIWTRMYFVSKENSHLEHLNMILGYKFFFLFLVELTFSFY